jgi:saccharopine dehydrogenase-like NADP-dependent oxidoreductase
MKKILVIGLGKVGALVGMLLNKRFEVTGLDKSAPVIPLSFQVIAGDITDDHFLERMFVGQDAVVSCMPYNLNLPIAVKAFKFGIHYFDLTEDVGTTAAIREMAKESRGVMAPQCGLAPGFVGIVGSNLAKKFTKLRDIELRVGALPRYPNGLLGYSFTWSPAGVVNEYINDAEVIHNGRRKMVPSLEGIETINIEGQEFEAFSTSGGLGTMCETFEGRVDTLNYKTIRYPGHCSLMRFMLYELILKEKRALIEQILTEAKPPVQQDVVYVYAAVAGWKGNLLEREEFYRAYHPIQIDGQHWRAISWTTAASIAGVVEMVADGTIQNHGFVKQEDIALHEFLKTSNGGYFYDAQIPDVTDIAGF